MRSRWYGAERPKWLGPLAFDYPEHLTGEAPGDYGFDPCAHVGILGYITTAKLRDVALGCGRQGTDLLMPHLFPDFVKSSLFLMRTPIMLSRLPNKPAHASAEPGLLWRSASSTATSSWSCCTPGGPCSAPSAPLCQVRTVPDAAVGSDMDGGPADMCGEDCCWHVFGAVQAADCLQPAPCRRCAACLC